MWEESTCLRFKENLQARDAIRYVLENGDSCFTEYIGRNGGFQDIISKFLEFESGSQLFRTFV